MAGLGPAIHDFLADGCKLVDARTKCGHDVFLRGGMTQPAAPCPIR
jgi:hypothetical protein